MFKALKYSLIGSTLAIASMVTAPSYAFEPFLGQLMPFGGNFCPRGWAKAEGQLLPISQNQALYSIFGTLYGGDGRTTFGLPDLRGRAPIGAGMGPGLSNRSHGEKVGSETQQILVQNMPEHNHQINATNSLANKGGPGDKYFAASTDQSNVPPFFYSVETPNRQMADGTVSDTGGSQLMNIQAPRLALQWCVATIGLFPSRD